MHTSLLRNVAPSDSRNNRCICHVGPRNVSMPPQASNRLWAPTITERPVESMQVNDSTSTTTSVTPASMTSWRHSWSHAEFAPWSSPATAMTATPPSQATPISMSSRSLGPAWTPERTKSSTRYIAAPWCGTSVLRPACAAHRDHRSIPTRSADNNQQIRA
jgi:hypothetical protein